MPESGGPVETLVTIPWPPRWLARDDGTLYWAALDNPNGVGSPVNTIMSMPTTGGTPTPGLVVNGPVEQILVDESYLFIRTLGQVIRARKDGTGTPLSFFGSWGSPISSIAIDDAFLYCTEGDDTPSVLRAPKAGGPEITFAPTGSWPLALDATHVFWLAGSFGLADIAIHSKPKDQSGPVATFPIKLPLGSMALSVDETHMYWATDEGLLRAPKP
jgi:hypothetical protein